MTFAEGCRERGPLRKIALVHGDFLRMVLVVGVHRAKKEVRKYYLEARLRRNFPRETIARETGIPEEALKAFGHKKWLPLSDEHIRFLARWLQQRGVGPTM